MGGLASRIRGSNRKSIRDLQAKHTALFTMSIGKLYLFDSHEVRE